jgi:hypothetical protein
MSGGRRSEEVWKEAAGAGAGAGGGKGSFEELKARKQSPRKLLRRISAADEVERELREEGDVSTIREEDSIAVDEVSLSHGCDRPIRF